MKSEEYVKNVLLLENRDFSVLTERFASLNNIRMMHGVLGLASEIGEVQQVLDNENLDSVNLLEEMGDVYWYMGVITDHLGFSPSSVFSDSVYPHQDSLSPKDRKEDLQSTIHSLSVEISNLVDLLKKRLIYGKEISANTVFTYLVAMDHNINYALSLYSMSGAEARVVNIAKLKKRYPQKFTEEAALNRNLEAERAVLENNDQTKV